MRANGMTAGPIIVIIVVGVITNRLRLTIGAMRFIV
jgi:hypothetical protein